MHLAVFLAVLLGGVTGMLYARYPACQPGHVAVIALQLKGGWACVQGYDPSPPGGFK